ncbi:hypothetical protein D187_008993 [Cystobacter fuscus DSM 2262]|uniref:Uncharacterized protein n=1 Tax=Cystobacter fuscus (strain ATCC 25194 / DSM 2262 / NBRC 100088 / M29) TaxID=1242864 RepID=S9NZC6_CYSF2|nr:hypothetical protein D187_008993 [Cystobacter fuscus DSM 2262]
MRGALPPSGLQPRSVRWLRLSSRCSPPRRAPWTFAPRCTCHHRRRAPRRALRGPSMPNPTSCLASRGVGPRGTLPPTRSLGVSLPPVLRVEDSLAVLPRVW